MVRYRRTLALIILLPILATVITAFRIRDLPKSHDSAKLETKTQQCENCDVKVGQKVHSVKIESDKQKNDDLNKVVREKQQLVNERVSDAKSTHKFIVRSDLDSDEDDLEFSKISLGKQEKLKDNKHGKDEYNEKHKPPVTKPNKNVHVKSKAITDDEDDDDDDDDENIDNTQSKMTIKSKQADEKTTQIKVNIDINRIEPKVAVQKQKTISTDNSESDDDDDDDEADSDENSKSDLSQNKAIEKIKTKKVETKKTFSDKVKREFKIKETKVLDLKKQKSAKSEEKDEKDTDNDDDGDDDDYKGLDNIDELFKILEMKPGSKLKDGSGDIKQKNVHRMEIKLEKPVELQRKKDKKVVDDENFNDKDDDDDDDEDDDDDDDEDDDDDDVNKHSSEDGKSIEFKKGGTNKPSIKSLTKIEFNAKKPIDVIKKETTKIKDKPEDSQSLPKNTKDKSVNSKPPTEEEKEMLKNKEDKKLNIPTEAQKHIVVKEKTNQENVKKDNDTSKSDDNKKSDHRDERKKEDEKPKMVIKPTENKSKSDLPKETKDTEKDTDKTKLHDKDSKSSSHEDKKPTADLKKDIGSHKNTIGTPEIKTDTKYDFEKPNAYKDSHKSFDYSEFEKIQVTKTQPKEKKKAKASSEMVTDSREEKYLKHVSDALNRRNLLKSEFEDFYAFFPTFAPNFSRIHNQECRRHGQILLRQLRGTKLWALNMLDATAKIPSGVLQGNGIQLGDFDQCLGSRARVQLDTGSVVKVQGKYCLARLDVKAEHGELEGAVYLAQAKSLIRSRIDDPGHFVPRFSTLSWGVCVPAACDQEDVEVIVKDALKHYQHKSGLLFKVKVDEDDCHTDEGDDWEKWLETPTILTLSFYGVVLLLVLVATVQDFVARRQSEESQEEAQEETETDKKDEENKEQKTESDSIISPFSLYRTLGKLTAPGTSDEISCIHGVRGIATVALLVAHKFMPVAVMPYTNRLRITEVASSPLWSWCRAGWIFTDCFLLLSGALTSHRIASDNSGVIKRLFSRYLRLTPALLAVVLFYAYIWDKLSTGPMWGSFVTKNAEICEQSWWWNLLYVQNYFGLENMCAPQTHQLALDMQLTIFGGVIVWAIHSGLPYAKLTLPAAHLLSAYFKYTTVRDHRLTLLAYHGVSVSQLYRTAKLSYTSSLHRSSPYLIGLSLGLALQKPSKHGKFLLTLGWITSAALSVLVFWSGLDSGSTQYRYNATFAAQYATIAPVASAMAIAWVIYAVHSGTCEFLSRALCWRPLVFISRLSYALYLCQFIIFITNIGTVRTSKEFTIMSLIDVQEILAIIISSILLTVTFVIPMQSLHKVLSFQWKSEPKDSTDEEQIPLEQKLEPKSKIDEKTETAPPVRSRHNLVAHREMLEEIPELEVEYETQRESIDSEGLDEILEEEEGALGEEEEQIDDLEIIEEEEAGEEEAWLEREGERTHSRQDDQDLDEWEWTANGSGRTGAQYYRYAR